MSIKNKKPIDWRQVVLDLRLEARMHPKDIARAVYCEPYIITGSIGKGIEPRYSLGIDLLALHRTKTKKNVPLYGGHSCPHQHINEGFIQCN